MNVAIIPARGGSKRIPGKNTRIFCGKPMIGHTIAVAQACEIFDRIIVSTDDPDIARVAVEQGADVPFMRAQELADDHVPLRPVLRDTILRLREHGMDPEWVCMLMATAPFMRAEDVRDGLRRLHEEPDKLFALSVTSFPFPIQRAVRIMDAGGLEPFDPHSMSKRSQDLEPAYHDAGQFIWGRAESFAGKSGIITQYTIPILLPRHRVQDIDTEEDWIRAECLYRVLRDTEGAHDEQRSGS